MPALRAMAKRGVRRRQRTQSGPVVRHDGSASSHRTQHGGASRGTESQHESQTGLASGRASGAPHAAQSGARKTRTSALVASANTTIFHAWQVQARGHRVAQNPQEISRVLQFLRNDL